MKRTPPSKTLATLIAATTLALGLGGGCATEQKTERYVGDISPGSFVKAWELDVGLKKVNSVHLGDQTLLVYGDDNQIVAYDLQGGLKFRTQLDDQNDIVGAPMVQAERVLIPTSSSIEVLSHKGIRRKSIDVPTPMRSPGVAVGETVYVGTSSTTGGRLTAVALDRDYPRIRREILTRTAIHHKPAVHENVVYFATVDGRVYAVNSDLTRLWPAAPEMPDGVFQTDGRIDAAIKADEAGVYVPSTDGKLYCLDVNTGRIRWQYIAGTPLKQSPVTTSDTIYQPVRGRGLVALDKKGTDPFRTPRWSHPDAKQVLNDDAQHTYVLSDEGRVLALDKATGALKFKSARKDFVRGVTHINPKDATLYVTTKSNSLLAFRPVLKTGVVGELVMLEPGHPDLLLD